MEVDGACVAEPVTEVICGEGTTLQNGACVADPVPAGPLQPGTFQAPLVELQRLQGSSNHMHISEVRYRESDRRLFSCSYYFGVINATDPQRMSFQAQMLTHETPSGSPRKPGCNHFMWDDEDPDLIFVTHRKNIDFATFLSSWRLAPDPLNAALLVPVQGPALQEEGVSYEGIDVEGGHVYAAIHEHGLGVYSWDIDGNLSRVGTLADLENAWDVVVHGDTAFIGDGLAGLVIADVSDPTAPVVLSRLPVGGQVRDLQIEGEVAWLAAGAAGLVAVDISDVTAPQVLSVTDTPGTAAGLSVHSGRVAVASWTDSRLFPADPEAPELIGAVRNELNQAFTGDGGERPNITARTFSVALYGDTLFVGNWWVPYSYQIHDTNRAPYIMLPEEVNNLSFPAAAVGGASTQALTVKNDGTAPLTLYHASATDTAFRVEPSQLYLEPGASADLTITFEPTTTDPVQAELILRSDDPNQPVRTGWLYGNQPGLGLGVPLPETTGELIEGGTWSSSDHLGDVLAIGWFATFCPVCSTELPDLEVNVWQRYRDQGLTMVALDPNAADDIGGITEFIDHLGVTFPVGKETSTTYQQIQANYDGANPYPTDVLVDRNGIIRYIAVEYDPEGLQAALDELMAE